MLDRTSPIDAVKGIVRQPIGVIFHQETKKAVEVEAIPRKKGGNGEDLL